MNYTQGGGYTILPRKATKDGLTEAEPLKMPISQPAEASAGSGIPVATASVKADPKPLAPAKPADLVVRGIVTDATKAEAIPGVSVVLKGTNRGTNTDVNGTF